MAPKTAVIIATKDRYDLLSQRALPSVLEQEQSPDFLIVIDDSSPQNRPGIAALVGSQTLPGCEIRYLENQRSAGASGSWNTAIEALSSWVKASGKLFVAFLDDDDAWSPNYLKACYALACKRRLDMVAADLRRFEFRDTPPLFCEAPELLRAEDFLVTNPGIQGSNLFLCLSVLLAAGGFDEELPSTTDRDLCIRIADLHSVRYSRLPLALVDHFANSDRPRLSTRRSDTKLTGLTSFWNKYYGRMSEEQHTAFLLRASDLFGWQPPSSCKGDEAPVHKGALKTALVLGIATYDLNQSSLLKIANDFSRCQDEGLIGLDVILLDNQGGNRRSSDLAAKMLRDAGAGCFQFSAHNNLDDSQTTRHQYELLSLYGARISKQRPGSQVWLIGDLNHPKQEYLQDRIHDLLSSLGAVHLSNSELSLISDNYTPAEIVTTNQNIERERIATARHRVKKRFSLDDIRELGSGSEAVVFTDGRTVYKCIDYWKTRMPQSQLEFLRGQIHRWESVPGLYPLQSVEADGPWVILTYEYEDSSPYRGGREPELIKLLEGCCKAGIVCNNIHPKNLVVTSSGLKLIDYGSDIRRWSPLGFEHMARRAFLSCKHSGNPELKELMRSALTDLQLPELDGYQRFRALVSEPTQQLAHRKNTTHTNSNAPAHDPFPLFIGVITSAPFVLLPLLSSLAPLSQHASIKRLRLLILDNGSPQSELEEVICRSKQSGLEVVIVSESQQSRDANRGVFGNSINPRPPGQVSIACARTMLQRYLGEIMKQNAGSIGWILDDDMRVDKRAHEYLPWLPSFQAQGVDVLFGAYEGTSPNPPLNGLRVQLLDLFHNLKWLNALPDGAFLPDRSAENAALRDKYPDYYYDLSRKHTGHLETPFWLEPVHKHETVLEARSRLIAGALGILNGEPLTRPVISTMPANPLKNATNSVNRGGCTFVLNPHALTLTPNSIPKIQGREARRSDMVWAIVNRYYRQMCIKAVGFPIHHIGRVSSTPSLNASKVQGEIVGSALYAGLTEFLNGKPQHTLSFSRQEIVEVCELVRKHMGSRLLKLEQSFYRVAGLRRAIEAIAPAYKLDTLLDILEREFNVHSFHQIRTGVQSLTDSEIHQFLSSLRSVADEFSATSVNIDFLVHQFNPRPSCL